MNTRSNAFEVSNNGHSIDYHTNGSGGATPGGVAPPIPGNGAIYGARYQDNTVYARGDIEGFSSAQKPWVLPLNGEDTVYSDFGVQSVQYILPGQYLVTQNTVDPYTGKPINFSGVSITATSASASPTRPSCVLVMTSTLGASGVGPNQFYFWASNPAWSCAPEDARIMFHVCGRR